MIKYTLKKTLYANEKNYSTMVINHQFTRKCAASVFMGSSERPTYHKHTYLVFGVTALKIRERRGEKKILSLK